MISAMGSVVVVTVGSRQRQVVQPMRDRYHAWLRLS
jgi:hypothetical protein